MNLEHADEFRRCLVACDVAGIRRLWRHVSPGLPQPASDAEALHTIHEARVRMKSLPTRLRDYSRSWLAERATVRLVPAVGIAVAAPPHRQARALDLRAAMSEAVLDAVKAGVDLATEPDEVKRRMMRARDRV